MLYTNVKGGTHAGWRKLRLAPEWVCECDKTLRAYSCAACGARRPK